MTFVACGMKIIMGDHTPCDRSMHTCCVQGGNVYLLGGREKTILNDFWRYSVVHNEWTELDCTCEGAPEALEQSSMVADQGRLYVFGGMIDSAYTDWKIPLWQYDIDKQRWKHCQEKDSTRQSTAPVNRKGHSAVVFEGAMYVFGGYVDLKGSSGEFWKFDFGSGVWSSLTSMREETSPAPRHGHSAMTHLDGMYVYGGLTGLREQSDFWRWSFSSQTWTSIRSHSGPSRLVGHSTVLYKDNLLLFGGGENQHFYSNTLWRFSFPDQTWEKLGCITSIFPPVKMYHCSVGLGPSFKSQSAAACSHLQSVQHAPRHGSNKVKPFPCFPDILSRPVGLKEDIIDLQTFYEENNSQENVRQARDRSRERKLMMKGCGLTFENQEALSREGDSEVPTALEENMFTHPDVLLVIGGKPLHRKAGISVWQMTLSDL